MQRSKAAALMARLGDFWRSERRQPSDNSGIPDPRALRQAISLRSMLWSLAASCGSIAMLGAGGALAFAFVAMAPRVPDGADLWNVNRQPAIIVLDRNGEEIAARGARYGAQVRPDELPTYFVDAILATEDRRFYDHAGLDIRGMLRALTANLRSGSVVEGGSTITQQLAKNLFLSPDRTYRRKLREALLAFWLEGHYSKDDILSLYLNRIYLGAGAYGVEAAAQTYFGKSAREVTLAEAAMIAGLPKAPSSYAPTRNPEGAARRAGIVIDNLLDIKAVEPFDAHAAKAAPAKVVNQEADDELGYFFDYVVARAKAHAPADAGDIFVKTTINQKLQRYAEAAVKTSLTEAAQAKGAEQAALVAYSPDGALLAMVGGRSYKKSQFNRASQATRQPGSAFKPFVYVAGFEAGLSPTSRFMDQPVQFEDWAPSNYTDFYRGPVRLTDAMAHSINTVAAQVTERVGPQKVAEAAMRFGVDDVPPYRAISLGAVEVTLEELTAAYIPFARKGLKPEPYAIIAISTEDGEDIYTHKKKEAERVMTEEVAKDMTHMLHQVLRSGTGQSASLGRRDAAGKTGTTNDWRDAWFMGYTAQLTAGVWVGNDEYKPMDKVTGGTIPADIWRDFMVAAHQDLPLKSLPGAYPAPSYSAENVMLEFYRDLDRGLSYVERGGNARRGRRGR